MAKKKRKKTEKNTPMQIGGQGLAKKLFDKYYFIAFLLIALAGILVYLNSFDCSFQWDDRLHIIEEPDIRNPSNFTKLSSWSDINSRPLALFTFSINYYFNGLDVFGYHLVNLVIHIAAGWLVFLLINIIFSTTPIQEHTCCRYGKEIALFTSIIFITHPVQTQSVTYIVQRMNSLASLFYLISIYLYIKGRLYHVDKGPDRYAVLTYAGAVIAGLLSVLSKQNTISFPAAFLMVEFFFIRDSSNKPLKKYLLFSISAILITFLAVLLSGNLPSETKTITRADYFITQFRVLVKYIQLLLVPVEQNIDYDFSISNTIFNLKVISSLAFLLMIIAAGIWQFSKNRILSLSVFWFFLTLSVESGIIPIRDVIFEHRLYLPMAGYGLLLSTVVFSITNWKKKTIPVSILLVLSIAYGTAAHARNRVWKTKYSLWADTVKKSPLKARPYYNLGFAQLKMGKQQEAIANLKKTIEIDPEYTQAMNSLGFIYSRIGEFEKSRNMLQRALEINPDNTDTIYNMGTLLQETGNITKAISFYDKVLKLKPRHMAALNNIALAWMNLGNFDRSVQYYRVLLKIDPKQTSSLHNLAYALSMKGDYQEAIELYNELLKINPGDTRALIKIGTILGIQMQFNKSITFFNRVLEIDSDNIEALNNLGIAYSKKGNREKAIEYFRKVLEINPDYGNAKKNLSIILKQ